MQSSSQGDSGDRAHANNRSRDKDHRSDHGPYIVMTVTGTVPAMTGTVMTDIMISTTANIMTGVMTGGMMVEVDTCFHVGVLLIDLQTIPGLMTAIQMT